METINDVLSRMNELYFKRFLTEKEYDDFENIREIVFEEFFDDDPDKKDLCELLDLIDQMHIKYLTEKLPANEDIIFEFRELTFKLIDQKAKIVKEHNLI